MHADNSSQNAPDTTGNNNNSYNDRSDNRSDNNSDEITSDGKHRWIDNQPLTWQFQKLPNKALWQMRTTNVLLRGIVWLLIITAVYVFFTLFIESDFALMRTPSTTLLITLVSLLWFVIVTISWFTTSIEYNYTAYHLDESGLIIRKGMFWRSETYALRSRIQHIDVTQTPLDRLFGLATIKVYTAGTKLGSIALRGLYIQQAERIRDELISNTNDTL